MKTKLLLLCAIVAVSGCEQKSATLDYSYQEGVQPIDSDFSETQELVDPIVEQTVVEPVNIETDSGIDLGDVAIGFVAAELLDSALDTRKTDVVKVETNKRVEPSRKRTVVKKKKLSLFKKKKSKLSFFKKKRRK